MTLYLGTISVVIILRGLALICLLCLFLLVIKIVWKKWRMERLTANIPSPPSLPIIGHMHLTLQMKTIADAILVITRYHKYGGLVKFWNFHQLVFIIFDPCVAETLLTSPEAVEKGKLYKFFSGNIGGVFIADRDQWHKMRKFVNLTFNPKLMEDYIELFNKHALRLVDILDEHRNQNMDPHPFLARCMIDTIIETHFGIESNEQTFNRGNVFESMSKLYENAVRRCYKIWLYPDFIYKRTNYYYENKKAKQQPSSYFLHVVKKCLQRVDMEHSTDNCSGRKKAKYYVDMLAESLIENGQDPDPKVLQFLTSDIIIAGYDTSSATLAHLLYHLAVNPRIQKNVHSELDKVFKGREYSTVQKQDLFKLQYLDMVIKETVRLYCPPVIVRELKNDLKTEKGVLPAGSFVCVFIYDIHRRSEFWDHPYDFYPEHFLPEKVAARPKYAFLAFSAGPRNCPGMLYSNWAVKVIAATLLRKYRIESDIRPEAMQYKVVLMLEPINGFSIRLISRT